MPALLSYLTAELRYRWRMVRDTKDGGYSTEAVLVTALLVVIALAAFALLGPKIIAAVNGINL